MPLLCGRRCINIIYKVIRNIKQKTLARKLIDYLYNKYRANRKERIYSRIGKSFLTKKDADYIYDKGYIKEVDDYWSNYFKKKVNPVWHLAFYQVLNKKDARFIPHNIWRTVILPHFNRLDLLTTYRDKNLCDIFLDNPRLPKTLVKRIHGNYYNHNNELIDRTKVLDAIYSQPNSYIIKPSQTDNGYGVAELHISKEGVLLNQEQTNLQGLESQYGKDFIIQEKITQHPVMAKPHPRSVNTIRMVTFRWKGEIINLLAFARFGVDNKLTDNAGTGGLCCGITEEGRLNSIAVDSSGRHYKKHPTTGHAFSEIGVIPSYNHICNSAISLHKQLFHFDIVSWDFSIDTESNPILLEVNFMGASYIYQFAIRRPLFGELTNDILAEIRDSGRV